MRREKIESQEHSKSSLAFSTSRVSRRKVTGAKGISDQKGEGGLWGRSRTKKKKVGVKEALTNQKLPIEFPEESERREPSDIRVRKNHP